MKHSYSLLFVILIQILALGFINCKEKNETEPASATPQASVDTEEVEGDDNYPDIKVITTPIDKPFLKNPKCVNVEEAGLSVFDTPPAPIEPWKFAAKLSRFPWVEIKKDLATVRFKTSCSTGGSSCSYEEMYMDPQELSDCKVVAESIINMVKEKKPLAEVLTGLSIYGSMMKSEGTSSIYYYNPSTDEFNEDFGSMESETSIQSFKWKTKGSSLIIDKVSATYSDDVSFGDGEKECHEKETFKVIHAGGEIKGYACAFDIKQRTTCEITGINPSSDGKMLAIAGKVISSEPEADSSVCNASIPLEGYDPFPVQTIME
jgi:hypothetical protein